MPYILLIIVFIVIRFLKIKNKSSIKLNHKQQKLEVQSNKASRQIAKQEAYMEYLDSIHNESQCKYSTQDPNFSFNGRPNNYDDFAELRKRNEKHEKHLQQRLL